MCVCDRTAVDTGIIFYCLIVNLVAMFQEVTSHTKLQDVSLLGTQFLTDDAFKNLANTKSLHRIRIEGN